MAAMGYTLESLDGRSGIVLAAHLEYGVCRSDSTSLVSILPVDAEVESFGHEYDTSRVAIDTVKSDGCVACWVSKEIDALVGVCQDSASQGAS